jgi:release factor family 3
VSITLLKDTDLKDLSVLHSSGLTLSIYLAVDQINSEINRIRFKNTMAEAQALLEERLEDTNKVGQIVSRIAELSETDAFTKSHYPGLAIVLDIEKPEDLAAFPLWEEPESRVSLADDPYLSPLIRDRSFGLVTLLCIADNGLRIFRGRPGELSEETPGETFPKNLAEVMRFELRAGLDGNEHYRNKTSSPGAGSPHGEGPTSKVHEEFERRYFRQIGVALSEFLNSGEKLFLAGVREKLALFRDENSDLPILEEELHGNFEEENSSKILEQANKALARSMQKQLSSELQRARELPPAKRSAKPEELIEAAKTGRVETLFLNQGSQIEDQDSLALHVIKTGGRVHMVDEPGWSGDALGTFRW